MILGPILLPQKSMEMFFFFFCESKFEGLIISCTMCWVTEWKESMFLKLNYLLLWELFTEMLSLNRAFKPWVHRLTPWFILQIVYFCNLCSSLQVPCSCYTYAPTNVKWKRSKEKWGKLFLKRIFFKVLHKMLKSIQAIWETNRKSVSV